MSTARQKMLTRNQTLACKSPIEIAVADARDALSAARDLLRRTGPQRKLPTLDACIPRGSQRAGESFRSYFDRRLDTFLDLSEERVRAGEQAKVARRVAALHAAVATAAEELETEIAKRDASIQRIQRATAELQSARERLASGVASRA